MQHSRFTFNFYVFFECEIFVQMYAEILYFCWFFCMFSLSTSKWFVWHFLIWCFDPKRINSVLDVFILSLFPSIQCLICFEHFSSVETARVSFLVGRNFIFRAWSSAYPCRSIFSSITSYTVDAYSRYSTGPAHEPCGTEKGKCFGSEYALPTFIL